MKTETHKVTGISHYINNLKSLSFENDVYSLPKKELIDIGYVDERIYKNTFNITKVALVPEPENEFDKNAVRVELDDVVVGYIKKGSCTHIKNLLKNNLISSIKADVYGGRCKILYEDYDYEKDKEVSNFDSADIPYGVTLKITTVENDETTNEVEMPANSTTTEKKKPFYESEKYKRATHVNPIILIIAIILMILVFIGLI